MSKPACAERWVAAVGLSRNHRLEVGYGNIGLAHVLFYVAVAGRVAVCAVGLSRSVKLALVLHEVAGEEQLHPRKMLCYCLSSNVCCGRKQ